MLRRPESVFPGTKEKHSSMLTSEILRVDLSQLERSNFLTAPFRLNIKLKFITFVE